MAEPTTERPIHQPIHPDIRDRLDPEYAAYHTANNLHVIPLHLLPWDPAVRLNPPVAGGSEPLKVGDVQDLSLSKCAVRVFTPEGSAPQDGWPVYLFFHGGEPTLRGWTLGNINTENAFSTNMCQRANCVVVSVDYRLAPENPYPAAVEDAVESLKWVYEKGAAQLNVNVNKIAVGGSSSGANLAAILTHKAALMQPPIPLVFQVLTVPVTDNTASISDDRYPSWAENQNTIGLMVGRMLWFRNYYLPNEKDRLEWDSSPIFAPEETFKKAPKAWIAVGELDILRDEGVVYAEKLKQAGIEVELKIYKGAPHPIMAMDGAFAALVILLSVLTYRNEWVRTRRLGVLQIGRQLVSDAALALRKAFETQ
ncbi:uncharacterized protein FIBRA_01054 [Fibroporia radiculosa]|uniref:Alpha/beta hydrolase fold-3 domain-containing protein n=1 Tax=Fibroporia radiculosa TaxID=599839 RepID=J4GJ78_9APHY|nr:uncharacterized protein FIBRA_01054 [Fibroporia radiculosa]CCL99045.1 predicted protein [Fibroporia radiculosa]